MHCPYCRHTDTKVLDSRVSEDGTAIRRRRRCESCEKRFTTVELMQLTVLKRSGATEPFNREKAISGVRKACKGRPVSEDDLARLGQQVEDALKCEGCDKRFTTVELMQLTVLKRSGATEPFTRDKAIAGVRKACKGRPVSEHDLACLGQTVEDALRNEGAAEVPAHEIGLAILGPLRALDPVAYLRFASVYKAFSSADDFEDEIALLRMEQAVAPNAVPTG